MVEKYKEFIEVVLAISGENTSSPKKYFEVIAKKILRYQIDRSGNRGHRRVTYVERLELWTYLRKRRKANYTPVFGSYTQRD